MGKKVSMATSVRGPLLVLLGAVCFSTSGFSQAVAPEGASPMVLICLRMLVGAGALWCWCAAKGMAPRWSGWPVKNLVLSALALLSCQVFFFVGLRFVGVAVGTVVGIGIVPIATVLLAWFVLGERPVTAWYLATFLAIAGLVMLNWGLGEDIKAHYLILPLATGFCYAVYLVFSKPLLEKHAPETVMAMLCLISGLCLVPSFFFFPTQWILSTRGMLVSLNLGIVTAALAFSFVLAGLRNTPTATASTLSLAEPLCAALLGIICLKEPITWMSTMGLAAMLGSVLLLILRTPVKVNATVPD